jgi:hypothetical protein
LKLARARSVQIEADRAFDTSILRIVLSEKSATSASVGAGFLPIMRKSKTAPQRAPLDNSDPGAIG